MFVESAQILDNIFEKSMESIEEIKTLPELDISESANWINRSRNEFGKNINKKFTGPTIDSNVIIPNRITVGGYPCGEAHSKNNVSILKTYGVTKFVCLNDEYGTAKCEKYDDKLESDSFIHFPMKDMYANTNDMELFNLCEKLANMVLLGEHLYIHCGGGHGRTGIVVSIVLKLLYKDLTVDDIFNYIQYSHDQRKYHRYGVFIHTRYIWDPVLRSKFCIGQVPTPQTSEQHYQVKRVISMM